MTSIISKERFLSQVKKAQHKHAQMLQSCPSDQSFRAIGPRIYDLRKLYDREKIYAVKQMQYFRQYQRLFTKEKRALMVTITELLQKLILHKKLESNKKSTKHP